MVGGQGRPKKEWHRVFFSGIYNMACNKMTRRGVCGWMNCKYVLKGFLEMNLGRNPLQWWSICCAPWELDTCITVVKLKKNGFWGRYYLLILEIVIWPLQESLSTNKNGMSEGSWTFLNAMSPWQVSFQLRVCSGISLYFMLFPVDVDMSYSEWTNLLHIQFPCSNKLSFEHKSSGIWDGFEEPCPIKRLANGPQPAYLQSNECSTDQNNPKYLPVGEDYLTIQLNCLNRLYPPASFNKDMQDTFNQTHLTCVLRNHLEASVVNVSYLPSLGLPRGEK